MSDVARCEKRGRRPYEVRNAHGRHNDFRRRGAPTKPGLLLLGSFVLRLLPSTILVFFSVAETRCFAAALDAEDIARLSALGIGIRPVRIGICRVCHTSSP
jgi:hypothetical protein